MNEIFYTQFMQRYSDIRSIKLQECLIRTNDTFITLCFRIIFIKCVYYILSQIITLIRISLMKLKKSQPSIKVAVRIRPLLSTFQDQAAWSIEPTSNSIISLGRQTTNDKTPKKRYVEVFSNYRYTFDHVFGNDTSTKDIYEKCCLQMIDGFLDGENSTIFMYGQTTSGKTYTMLGNANYEGLITFSLKDIFLKFSKKYTSKSYKIAISYLEIYNEQINDLLNPGSINLKIIEDTVQGLTYCEASTLQEAEDLLVKGEQQRSYKQKSIHDHSSRSHTIFQIKIYDIKQTKSICSLNLVDLAGSQRLTDEDRINDSTQQTGYINKSLFVLSNVINKLAKSSKKTHIPFRDSKLTRLLSNSLIGRSNTLIICTVSPAAMNFYQTLSTLRFATNAKKMERQLTIFEDSFDKQNRDKDSTSSKDIESMKQEIWKLRKLLKESQKKEEALKQKLEQVTNTSYQTPQNTKGMQKISPNEKQFLFRLKEQIEEKIKVLPAQWTKKSSDLCSQYSKNIDLLQYKYKVALFNIAESQCTQNFLTSSSLVKQTSNMQILDKIQNRSIFDGLAVSGLLNVDCTVEVSPKQLQTAFKDAQRVLADKFLEMRKFLSAKKQERLQQSLQRQFDQKVQIIEQAYKNVCRTRGFV